ncbi:hypothetical protein GLYMA_09G107800v4 [Glycine max]|nr:hypothetical protein GLYMA_09G107800v4 [Glycine max]KAG4388117.1 hypothetical protein GLYMA_09G107800v4 [Glycine max]KAH1042457.1 hypothetical protein GYH30_024648 [Glycine max]KAH1042458.1 hypothetical protein GYH30_024648 [Glycine max]KAH1232988.1 hypothetical protein GmHk_09G025524 [Glycine max]
MRRHCSLSLSLSSLTLVLALPHSSTHFHSRSRKLYGEISWSFVVRSKDELEHTWHLLQSNDNMHSITYNQDLVNPTLLVGWVELKYFYGLTRNHLVTMTHFGQSVFFLTISKGALNQKLILNDTPCTTKFLTQSLLKSY